MPGPDAFACSEEALRCWPAAEEDDVPGDDRLDEGELESSLEERPDFNSFSGSSSSPLFSPLSLLLSPRLVSLLPLELPSLPLVSLLPLPRLAIRPLDLFVVKLELEPEFELKLALPERLLERLPSRFPLSPLLLLLLILSL